MTNPEDFIIEECGDLPDDVLTAMRKVAASGAVTFISTDDGPGLWFSFEKLRAAIVAEGGIDALG